MRRSGAVNCRLSSSCRTACLDPGSAPLLRGTARLSEFLDDDKFDALFPEQRRRGMAEIVKPDRPEVGVAYTRSRTRRSRARSLSLAPAATRAGRTSSPANAPSGCGASAGRPGPH